MPVKKKSATVSSTKTPSRKKVSVQSVTTSFEDLFKSTLDEFGESDSFHITESLLKKKLSKSRNNCGYRYQTESGKVIEIWQSNHADVVEPNPSRGKGWFRIRPGVTVSANGGLIPPGSRGGSFFDDNE